VELPLDILYEDEDLLVGKISLRICPFTPLWEIMKNTPRPTLLHGTITARISPLFFAALSRLDRDTSGLTIIAKHMISANILSQMVAKREIHRKYLAIVTDHALPDRGTIDAPIGRKEGSVMERKVDFLNGERAITHYQVLARENDYALAALKLETGRTHQIRVHMKYMNCPLMGDGLYNPDDISYLSSLAEVETDTRILKRQGSSFCQTGISPSNHKEAYVLYPEAP